MIRAILVLFFLLIQNSYAQTIILNNCWNNEISEKDKIVKSRDVVIDLQRKNITIQGIDKQDKPYMVQKELIVDAVSTGFIKGRSIKNFGAGILENIYVFDLVNAQYSNELRSIKSIQFGHDKNELKTLQENLITCSGLNGKSVKNSVNSDQNKKNDNTSKPKSLLKKLLKKQ